MKGSPVLLLVALGGGAFLLYRYMTSGSPPGGQPSPGTSPGGGPPPVGFGQLGASMGNALGLIPGVGAILGAGAAVGGAGLDAYNAMTPDQQRQLKRTHEKIHNTFIGRLGKLDPVTSALKSVGVIKDLTGERRAKRKQLTFALGRIENEAQGAELHAQHQWAALARPDVEAWAIGQDGTLEVRYRGRADTFTLPVPKTAINPAAYAFELTSRLFGAPVQGGTGPITADFVNLESPGFVSSNPYAPDQWKQEGVAITTGSLKNSIARKH